MNTLPPDDNENSLKGDDGGQSNGPRYAVFLTTLEKRNKEKTS